VIVPPVDATTQDRAARTPQAPAPTTPSLSEQLHVQQHFLALEDTYHAELRTIEEHDEATLTQAATAAAHQQRRRLWHVYEAARGKQYAVYREVHRQWARLYAAYHQLLFGQQEAQQ
jgi:hypothetical protein